MRNPLANAREDAVEAMTEHSENWEFWIRWFERVLDGLDWHPAEVVKVLNTITRDDWDKGPAHINPMFDQVLALYRAEDESGPLGGEGPRKTVRTAVVRAQVSTLQEYLDTEYRELSGHNQRSTNDDEVLDLLRQLKELVAEMMRCFDAASNDGQAIVVVNENLPAVIEKTGELAVVEPSAEKATVITMMSAAIKELTDAGADQKLATIIAAGTVGSEKIWNGIRIVFGRKNHSD